MANLARAMYCWETYHESAPAWILNVTVSRATCALLYSRITTALIEGRLCVHANPSGGSVFNVRRTFAKRIMSGQARC